MILLFKAIILGFAVSAPVGPVNLLCIRRTLVFGKKAGIISGLGAATADLFFAIVAAFGFGAISKFLSVYITYFHIVGAIILFIIAWKIYTSKNIEEKHHDQSSKVLWKYFLSTFLLTLTNPATLFSFAALFAGLRVHGNPILLVMGVFLGSMLWWTFLTCFVAHLHVSHDKFIIINKIAAVLIVVLGIISFLM